MGALADALADRVWLTSDNPRGEPPQTIIDTILAGMKRPPTVEPDRAAAIRGAIAAAAAADVVLIAGKGHETYQEIAGRRLPFSDLDQAARALEKLP
jgi:UDP-N-acetylmuramoyl-L-alanyl-D-glutamate--2,6-diaminopimelate ligase